MRVAVASFFGVFPKSFLRRGNSTRFYLHTQAFYPHIHSIHKERKRKKKKETTATAISFP